MGIGTVTRYEKFPGISQEAAGFKWTDATAGAYMFGLVTSSYTPSVDHATAADFGANIITSGDGLPINCNSRVVNYTPADDKTWYSSASANFGNTVTITAKYLVCMMPVTAGTYANTAKLCWYVDLNVGAGLSYSRTAQSYIIDPPTNGWFSIP